MGAKTGGMILLAAILLLGATGAPAQEMSLQGNNEARWADGSEIIGGDEVTKRYFENRLNLNLYYGNIRLGTRFTMLHPSEFGEQQDGVETLDKRFIEYDDPDANIRLRAGDFYTVWGRGLGLALVEDVIQGFDSGLDGLHGQYGYGDLELEALSGRSEQGFLGLVREANVSAGRVGYAGPLGVQTSLGGVLVTPVDDTFSYPESRTWTGHAAWDGMTTSLWAEYAWEDVEGVEDNHDALYASASWFSNRLSLFVDYKRYNYYRYGGSLSDAGNLYTQSIDILPFHSPPIVQREFTSALFSKHPHIVRFDDEVGVQVEATYNLGNANSITLNMSQSSSFVENDLWIPSLDEEQSPYRQAFIEFLGYPTYDWYLTAWAGMDEDLIYTNEGAVRARTGWLRRSVIGAGSEVQVADEWSVKGQLEAGLVEDVDIDRTSLETLSILGFTYQQTYSLSVTLETAENDPNQNKTTWLKGEFSAFLANRHELLLTIGEERGGLVCTSGKCRLVAPFEGVKLTFTSLF